MDESQLREIFFEEAGEIVERLDADMLHFERQPHDTTILNELFRGMHTLKGSANAFGFTRLGTLVHRLEDLFAHFRDTTTSATPTQIALLFDAVDMIRLLLEREPEGMAPPEGYAPLLEALGTLHAAPQSGPHSPQADLAAEFAAFEIEARDGDDPRIRQFRLEDGETLYQITLMLDDDAYLRGIDHFALLTRFGSVGRVLDSWWDMSDVPTLDQLDVGRCAIGKVELFFASEADEAVIQALFEPIEPHEYALHRITAEQPREAPTPQRRTYSYVKVNTGKLDALFDAIGEMVIAQNALLSHVDAEALRDDMVYRAVHQLTKITRHIQNRVMDLRMIPVGETFEKMRRVVRDASAKAGKEIRLVIEGAQTEIDKTMVDALFDPMIHLVRNAIDHGIETDTAARHALGKPAEGKVALRARHRGGSIVIEIIDDGRGIDHDRVIEAAVARGLIDSGEGLDEAAVIDLLMQPGFSSASQISDLSGRGVGLDVVNAAILQLHGRLEVLSEPGRGTTFMIELPLTLAIIDAMVVRVGTQRYIVPTLSVLEAFLPSRHRVHTLKQRNEFVDLRGEMLPIVRLNQALGIDDTRPDVQESTLLCVENDHGRFVILVDELIGRQQVVIKSLGSTLGMLRSFSGGAVMGNGEIALILNVEALYGP